MVGVLAGGAATWLAQGKHRRAARRSRAEADRWRAEAESGARAPARRPSAREPRQGRDAPFRRRRDRRRARFSLADRRARRTRFAAASTRRRASHHEIERAGEPAATTLLMPAWTRPGGRRTSSAPRSSTSFPATARAACPRCTGSTCCNRASPARRSRRSTARGSRCGAPPPLRRWRRAISRAPTRERLLIVGAGALAPFLARAHASQRPIESIAVWNHRPEGARRLAASAGRRRAARAGGRAFAGRGRRSRHHLLRDAVADAADRRRLAARPASTSTSSAPSRCGCARPTTRRSSARASSSTRRRR